MSEEDSNMEPKSDAVVLGQPKSDVVVIGQTTSCTTQLKQLPHNFEAILKDADSSVDKFSTEQLCHQLYAGIFLNRKKRKYWIDSNSNNCFMLLARDLTIAWGDTKEYWFWPYIKEEASDVFIEVAQLLHVSWLEVHGKFDLVHLSPGVVYEAVFVVMLTDPFYGWESPVDCVLSLPDGSKQKHEENMMEKPKRRWIEIPFGEFGVLIMGQGGSVDIALYGLKDNFWKRGLTIKGVAIRPKSLSLV